MGPATLEQGKGMYRGVDYRDVEGKRDITTSNGKRILTYKYGGEEPHFVIQQEIPQNRLYTHVLVAQDPQDALSYTISGPDVITAVIAETSGVSLVVEEGRTVDSAKVGKGAKVIASEAKQVIAKGGEVTITDKIEESVTLSDGASAKGKLGDFALVVVNGEDNLWGNQKIKPGVYVKGRRSQESETSDTADPLLLFINNDPIHVQELLENRELREAVVGRFRGNGVMKEAARRIERLRAIEPIATSSEPTPLPPAALRQRYFTCLSPRRSQS